MENNELLKAIDQMMDMKLEPINNRLEGLENRFDTLEQKVDEIKEKVDFTADIVEQTLKMQDDLEQRVLILEKVI